MRFHALQPLSLGLVLLWGCGGGGGNGSGDGEADPPLLGFAQAASSFSETAGIVEVELVLSEAAPSAVELPFTLGGSATENADYRLVTTSPLAILEGATEGRIRIELLDDDIAFGPLDIQLQLGTPTGAEPGAILTHVLAVADDESPLSEIEPNDNLEIASKNGPLATLSPGDIISLGGNVVENGDLFDVHRLQVPDPGAPVTVTATFVGPHPDLLVALANAQGIPYGDARDPDTVSFDVTPGRVYVVVQSTGAATDYQVRVEVTAR